MKNIGIYVHIPFCTQKCYYCDFCSYPNIINKQNEYVQSVIKEIKNVQNKSEYLIDTIYIGGGTPSIIEKENIGKILNEIKANFEISNIAEITIEVNPGTVNEEKLNYYKNVGLNRLSIGLQSTNDDLLKKIGRIHTYNDFENTYKSARNVGFKNINVDLMIGLPSQTLKDVEQSLKQIIKKNPEHISVYSLIVEENTPMEKLIETGKLILPNEDEERKMYWLVKRMLEENNYIHYEISNFAKKGYNSNHNYDCWNQKEYIGFGAGAHSYLDKKRFSNTNNVDEYIENISSECYMKNITIHEVQTKYDMMKEYMILGLRKIDGINIKEFEKRFKEMPLNLYKAELKKLEQESLIQISEDVIRLTDKGIDFANIVWEEFV